LLTEKTPAGAGGLAKHSTTSGGSGSRLLTKHAPAPNGTNTLPVSDVVLTPKLLKALIFILLHTGDALVPGVNGALLALLHHRVCAGGRLELGMTRTVLGRRRRAE